MRYSRCFFISILILTLMVSSCSTATGGPNTWIDAPLDNTVAFLAPLAIIVHASDSDGVASFDFFINGQFHTSTSVAGARLESREYEWTPPGAGIFLVGVRAVDTQGNTGSMTTSRVTISVDVTLTPESADILTVTPTATDEVGMVTPTDTGTITDTPDTPQAPIVPSVVAKTDANCRQGPETVFDVYGRLPAGQSASIMGRLVDNTWFLIALPNHSSYCWMAVSVVDILGTLDNVPIVEAPALPPLPQTESPPVQTLPPQPIDTTPPTISYRGINPWEIYVAGCGGFDQKVTLTIEASDEGGIARVEATWSIGSESGTVVMNYVGANRYQGNFGPVNTVGVLVINGSVVDNAGNWTPFQQTVTVKNCIE
jgi:hypothetical protein